MKKTVMFLFVLVAFSVNAQNEPSKKDSARFYKNEIGINILPLIIELSGANSGDVSGAGINYRRYLNPKNAIRVSVRTYPFVSGPYYKGDPVYYQKNDTFNIYAHTEYRKSLKPQLNIGYEFIFRRKRLIQSFGADLFFNYQHTEQKDIFLWAGQSSMVKSPADLTKIYNNRVDTMGSSNTSDIIGFGIQAFYNLRIPIAKHWLISTTLGPVFGVNKNRNRTTQNKTGEFQSRDITNFDVNFLLSDLSVCFRF